MNVLMVSSDYPPDIGGIAAHVRCLAAALAARGHALAVASVWPASGPASVVTDPDAIRVRRLPGEVRLGPIRIRIHRRRLRACVRLSLTEQRPDVIHIHGHAWEPYATRTTARHIPVVGTMHSSGFIEKSRTAGGRATLRAALRHLSAVTAPSRELAGLVDNLALPAGGCVYIPNGVDTVLFHPGVDGTRIARELALPPGRRIVLCARRLVPKNGVIDLVKALPAIVGSHPDVLAVFAGSELPEYGAEVRAAARDSGVEGACRFVGPVPNPRMPELVRLATVSVLPSLLEATSITALESMASGIALVATDVGGLPELIADEKTGLLVPRNNPGALAAAISRLLSDEPLARSLAAAARQRALEEFGWDRIAARVEAVYDQAVRGRRRAQT